MKNNIDTILEKQGKTRYWLAKEIGIAYNALSKLASNQTESIKFDIMQNICIALDCTLDELFTIERNKE